MAKNGEGAWGWDPCKVPRHRVLGLWGKFLRVGEESSFRSGKVHRRGVGINVGERNSVRFWFEDSVGGAPFSLVPPSFLELCSTTLFGPRLFCRGEEDLRIWEPCHSGIFS